MNSLEQELKEIEERFAKATPAEKQALEGQFSERLKHLRERIGEKKKPR